MRCADGAATARGTPCQERTILGSSPANRGCLTGGKTTVWQQRAAAGRWGSQGRVAALLGAARPTRPRRKEGAARPAWLSGPPSLLRGVGAAAQGQECWLKRWERQHPGAAGLVSTRRDYRRLTPSASHRVPPQRRPLEQPAILQHQRFVGVHACTSAHAEAPGRNFNLAGNQAGVGAAAGPQAAGAAAAPQAAAGHLWRRRRRRLHNALQLTALRQAQLATPLAGLPRFPRRHGLSKHAAAAGRREDGALRRRRRIPGAAHLWNSAPGSRWCVRALPRASLAPSGERSGTALSRWAARRERGAGDMACWWAAARAHGSAACAHAYMACTGREARPVRLRAEHFKPACCHARACVRTRSALQPAPRAAGGTARPRPTPHLHLCWRVYRAAQDLQGGHFISVHRSVLGLVRREPAACGGTPVHACMRMFVRRTPFAGTHMHAHAHTYASRMHAPDALRLTLSCPAVHTCLPYCCLPACQHPACRRPPAQRPPANDTSRMAPRVVLTPTVSTSPPAQFSDRKSLRSWGGWVVVVGGWGRWWVGGGGVVGGGGGAHARALQPGATLLPGMLLPASTGADPAPA